MRLAALVLANSRFHVCLVFAACVTLLSASQLIAQDDTKEHLKPLQHRIGTWDFKGTIGDENVSGKLICKWINDGNFLQQSLQYSTGEITHVIGWDPNAKELRSWGFGGSGGHGLLELVKVSDTHWKEQSLNWVTAAGDKAKFVLDIDINKNQLQIKGDFDAGEFKATIELRGEKN
ncbi:MAG: hypothetical protein NXI32_04110 [bacterium]|nr:hypothetical protein [bacterium]